MTATIKHGWFKFPIFRWLFWRRAQAPLASKTETTTVHYNTTGIDEGVLWFRLPSRAVVTAVSVEIVEAFNAGDTNVLTVGYTTLAEIVGASDVDETSIDTYEVTPGSPIAADKDIYIKYVQTGTAASAGIATVSLTYTPYAIGA